MKDEAISHTNSSLAAARRCLTLWDLRYRQRLERMQDEEREALAVGTCWHRIFDAEHAARREHYTPHQQPQLQNPAFIAEGEQKARAAIKAAARKKLDDFLKLLSGQQ